MQKSYSVYFITNQSRSSLYTGVTSDLIRRIYEHRESLIDGFTKKYNCKILVHFEQFDNVDLAIAREKEIKGWVRRKKDDLINRHNPEWLDLYPSIVQ